MLYGIRRGECAGIKLSAVDLRGKTITICSCVMYDPKNGVYEKPYPKKRKPRQLPITPQMDEILRRYLKWRGEQPEWYGDLWQKSGYLFTNEYGGPMNPDNITQYHNEELKSLTRYRFDKVKERAKLKSSVARLVNILFPELEKLVSSLHIAVVYALLSNYPGASYIANANTEELAETLCTASKGRYTKSKTAEIQVAAGVSIGSKMPAKSMELKHTIALIRELDKEISEVESAIDKITSQMDSPIFTIPGIGRHMSAMILAEVGDFSNFASADKLLAYAGLSPSTYQSGQLQNCYPVLCTLSADGCTAHVPDFPKVTAQAPTLDAALLEVKQQIQKALRQYKNPPIPTKQDQIVVPNNSVLVLVKAS